MNPDFASGNSRSGVLNGDTESFIGHFFEQIGLPNDHDFVKEKIRTNNYEYRKWNEFFMDERRRRTQRHNYNFLSVLAGSYSPGLNPRTSPENGGLDQRIQHLYGPSNHLQ